MHQRTRNLLANLKLYHNRLQQKGMTRRAIALQLEATRELEGRTAVCTLIAKGRIYVQETQVDCVA